MSEQDDLLLWLAEVSNDPLGYVLGAFTWGEGELARYPDGPDDWQREILTKIGDGVLSVEEAIAEARAHGGESECKPVMEATTSGHGIGYW